MCGTRDKEELHGEILKIVLTLSSVFCAQAITPWPCICSMKRSLSTRCLATHYRCATRRTRPLRIEFPSCECDRSVISKFEARWLDLNVSNSLNEHRRYIDICTVSISQLLLSVRVGIISLATLKNLSGSMCEEDAHCECN